MATERERARRDMDAAYAKATTALMRQREEQLSKLDQELQALRQPEKVRVVTEVREQMGVALTFLHVCEATWERLLEHAGPDPQERAGMLAAVELKVGPRACAGAAGR